MRSTTSSVTGKTRQGGELTVDEICVLIARCYHHKVTKISVRGVEVTFDTTSGRTPKGSDDQFVGQETPTDTGEGVEFTADQREIQEDLRLSQLMLDNPFAYEQEMIDANLDPRKLHARENGL